MSNEKESDKERKRREVLTAAQFARRKVNGALAECREALQSLDKLMATMPK